MQAGKDNELLHAALLGYGVQLQAIGERMAEIQAQLAYERKVTGVESGKLRQARSAARTKSVTAKRPGTHRTMSAEGRARIVAAQKKRWAANRKAAAGKVTKDGRKAKPVRGKKEATQTQEAA